MSKTLLNTLFFVKFDLQLEYCGVDVDVNALKEPAISYTFVR